ncbi:hypothetical protein ACJKIH_03040 [Brucella pseudogrignonensis]|uniref:hypothetical protein n=1 Tax=Brucella pseudogrignonensis TaxID=419475 RepID=UPI0038B50BF5
MELIHTPVASDLNRERGIDAYRWNSFTPEKRADADIAGYISDVMAFAAKLEEHALTPEKMAEAIAQVERYRLRYIEWENTLWAAKSRTASPMITGPARFPTDRNNKALESEHKKVGAYLEWREKAERAAIKAVNMVGYVAPPKPEGAKTGQKVNEFDGFKVVENFDIDRVQFVFPDKPTEAERAILKDAAFKWAPSQGAWQRQLTNNAIAAARRVIAQLNVAQTAS